MRKLISSVVVVTTFISLSITAFAGKPPKEIILHSGHINAHKFWCYVTNVSPEPLIVTMDIYGAFGLMIYEMGQPDWHWSSDDLLLEPGGSAWQTAETGTGARGLRCEVSYIGNEGDIVGTWCGADKVELNDEKNPACVSLR